MLMIDLLAEVAGDELSRLREEEQRTKRMQFRAEPIRFCRLKRTERGKVNASSCDDDGNVVAAPGITRESKPKKISSLKIKLNLKKKEEIGKHDDGDGAENNKGKTEVGNGPIPPLDLPTNFRNQKRKPETEIGNPPQDLPTKFRKKKRKTEDDKGPNPPPDLPPKLKNKILEKARGEGGLVGEAVLVIQKKLTATDIANHQNRFSIPLNQRRNGFLSEQDDNFIKGRRVSGKCNTLEVDIIEPKGKVKSVKVTRWAMSKDTGQPSISYVLNGEGWKKIKRRNKLKIGNYVQLWAVQIKEKPCLVFVKLKYNSGQRKVV